jgi:hypothetical protein
MAQSTISKRLLHQLNRVGSRTGDASKANAEETPPLRLLRDLAVLLGIYCYFTGWIYTYYYYQHFGISMGSVDMPVYYLFVYSYSVLNTTWGMVLVVVTLALAGAVVRFGERQWMLAPLLILLFPSLFLVARYQAVEDAWGLRTRDGKRVVFEFKDDCQHSAALVGQNSLRQLKLLTQTKERYFVLHQSQLIPGTETPTGELPYGMVYDIPRGCVVQARTRLRGY